MRDIGWRGSRALAKYWRSARGARDLHPYFTGDEVLAAIRYYIPTQFQSVSPAREDESGKTSLAAARQKLIPWMLSEALAYGKGDKRFYLVLADSGMGKATFMINLFLAYNRQSWLRRKRAIALIPLGRPDVLDKVRQLRDPLDTILLLDAFDEDPNAVGNFRQRLDAILDAVKDFREVVITCRTQFFPKEDDEPHATNIYKFGGEKGVHEFTKVYLSPFNKKDVRRYLRKRYGVLSFFKRKQAREVVNKCPNLVMRPMLLSYIDDLCQPGLCPGYPDWNGSTYVNQLSVIWTR